MKVEWALIIEILKATVLLFIGGIVTRFFEKKVKLISYYKHVSVFNYTPPQGGQPVKIFSHSVILRNAGKLAANNVRIQHLSLPDFDIWPAIDYHIETLPNGNKDIVIPILIPNEQITISYLYFPPLIADRVNDGIKCDQGFAKPIEVILQPLVGKVTKWFVALLMLLGLLALVYFIFLSLEKLATLAN